MSKKVVFERSRPEAAAALFDQLPTTEPAGHERRVSIEVQPTPERRGLFRRPVPVPSVSISVVFPPERHPLLLLSASGTDPFSYGSSLKDYFGDALAREVSAKGVETPDGWNQFAAFTNMVHWEVPFDEDPVRVIEHTLTVLEALCETPPETFEAKVELRDRYEEQTGTPEYMQ
jgi:hypothetical protein